MEESYSHSQTQQSQELLRICRSRLANGATDTRNHVPPRTNHRASADAASFLRRVLFAEEKRVVVSSDSSSS